MAFGTSLSPNALSSTVSRAMPAFVVDPKWFVRNYPFYQEQEKKLEQERQQLLKPLPTITASMCDTVCPPMVATNSMFKNKGMGMAQPQNYLPLSAEQQAMAMEWQNDSASGAAVVVFNLCLPNNNGIARLHLKRGLSDYDIMVNTDENPAGEYLTPDFEGPVEFVSDNGVFVNNHFEGHAAGNIYHGFFIGHISLYKQKCVQNFYVRSAGNAFGTEEAVLSYQNIKKCEFHSIAETVDRC